ncbi:hypothetical protein J4456_04865 [Candidatus Pacearchaeota archaeon]|nr:hypothetical protein [Candidatus Pacearchaeota archaeon]
MVKRKVSQNLSHNTKNISIRKSNNINWKRILILLGIVLFGLVIYG